MMEANEESRSHKDWLPLRAIALEEASCHIVSSPYREAHVAKN